MFGYLNERERKRVVFILFKMMKKGRSDLESREI